MRILEFKPPILCTCGRVEDINVSLAVDEEEAVRCGGDGGRLGRVHDLQVAGLPPLQVNVHPQGVEDQ